MRRAKRAPRHQLHLYQDCDGRPVVFPEDLHEEVVKTLADLLVEALGEERSGRRAEEGGASESEDHV